jgi:hypothetical protein
VLHQLNAMNANSATPIIMISMRNLSVNSAAGAIEGRT